MQLLSLPIIGPITRDISALNTTLLSRQPSSKRTSPSAGPRADTADEEFHYARPSHVRAWLKRTSLAPAPGDAHPADGLKQRGAERPGVRRSRTERDGKDGEDGSGRRPEALRRRTADATISSGMSSSKPRREKDGRKGREDHRGTSGSRSGSRRRAERERRDGPVRQKERTSREDRGRQSRPEKKGSGSGSRDPARMDERRDSAMRRSEGSNKRSNKRRGDAHGGAESDGSGSESTSSGSDAGARTRRSRR